VGTADRARLGAKARGRSRSGSAAGIGGARGSGDLQGHLTDGSVQDPEGTQDRGVRVFQGADEVEDLAPLAWATSRTEGYATETGWEW
jgi:hypothetical protein